MPESASLYIMNMLSTSLSKTPVAPRSAFLRPVSFHFALTSVVSLRTREAFHFRTLWTRPMSRVLSAAMPPESQMVTDNKDVKTVSRSVVVAVDESEESVKALQWTLDNFYRAGDVLHLLHVIPYVQQQLLTSTVYYTPPILDPEISEQLKLNAEEVVNEKYIPILTSKNVKYEVDMVQEKGSETIGDAVCHAAADLDACVVVVAAHKKHWLQKWLMGSSSQEIAGKAPIPVIVYHS